MNDSFIITAVCWESRNWRHKKKAVEWCKNYGLHPFTNNLYIGKLKVKERNRLIKYFQDTFINKTEKFYILPLCKTCYEGAELHKIERNKLDYPPFEIIG